MTEQEYRDEVARIRKHWWYPMALVIAASGATAAIIKVFS